MRRIHLATGTGILWIIQAAAGAPAIAQTAEPTVAPNDAAPSAPKAGPEGGKVEARQPPPASGDAQGPLGDIVVTARRSSETLQSTPIAVTAVTGETIQQRNYRDTTDVISRVPNVYIYNTLEAGDSSVIIRGVINARDVDPSYALVVDGVTQPDPFALSQGLVDIDQIEVVKGPVSALYGRNAAGGAIIIRSRPPSDSFEGHLLGEGGNGGNKRVEAAASGPLAGSALRAGLSASYTDRDGLLRNEYLGGHVDGYKGLQARGRLLWEPAPAVTVDLVSDYSRVRAGGANFNFQTPLMPRFASGIDVNDTSLPFATNVRPHNQQDRYDVSGRLVWKLGAADLTASAGHYRNKNSIYSDFIIRYSPTLGGFIYEGINDSFGFDNSFGLAGYTPFPGSIAYQSRDGSGETYEVQLGSSGKRRLRWNIGVYHANLDRTVFVSVDNDLNNGRVASAHPGPQTFFVSEDMRSVNDISSLYGSLAFDLLPNLELAAAARWDKDGIRSDNLASVGYTAAEYVGLVRRRSFNRVQPRFSLRWEANAALTIFGSYGESFRSGGFNAPGTRQTVLTVDRLPPTVNINDDYKEEIVKGFEIGAKGKLAGGRVRYSASAFLTNTANTQIFEFTPVTSTRARTNIDATRIKGAEADVTALLLPGLTATLAFGYTDARIRRYAANPYSVGNRLLSVPEYTASAGLNYAHQIASGLKLLTGADYQRIGPTPWDINNAPRTVRDPVDLLDLRIGVERGPLSLTAFLRNATGTRYNLENTVTYTRQPGPGTTSADIINFPYKNEPRSWSLVARYRF